MLGMADSLTDLHLDIEEYLLGLCHLCNELSRNQDNVINRTSLLAYSYLYIGLQPFLNYLLGLYLILIWLDIRQPDIWPITLPDTGYPAGYPAN